MSTPRASILLKSRTQMQNLEQEWIGSHSGLLSYDNNEWKREMDDTKTIDIRHTRKNNTSTLCICMIIPQI